MTIDDETLARIRVALEDSSRVDADRLQVAADGEEVVLRGAVATPEEATVAAMIAEQDAPTVRNELLVDAGLREGAGAAGAAAEQPSSSPQRSPEDPAQPDDLTPNAEEALGEGVAWDPPEAPSSAPTRAEERGHLSRDATAVPTAPEGEVDDADTVEPSAADLSAAELERSARPDEREDR